MPAATRPYFAPVKVSKRPFLLLAVLLAALLAMAAQPAPAAELAFTQAQLEASWQARIQSFLDRGVVPLIDLQSSPKRGHGEAWLDRALPVMDRIGLALIAFDTPASRKRRGAGGYAWNDYGLELVNAHPGRFIPATNGGTNPDWANGGTAFIGQLEKQVRSGRYPIMGKIEFRHGLSKRQCRKGRTDRDIDLAIDGANGHRLFRLAAETGVPVVLHHEPAGRAMVGLERMLKAYPAVKIILAHFGQIRHPEVEFRFGPAMVRRLLTTYPNLHYDISTGRPGRRYRCGGPRILDTVIWQDDGLGGQTDVLKPAYKAILTRFADRFVAAIDYGGGRRPLAEHLRRKVANIRLILRDLPAAAQHKFGYRNAWRLLTGRVWSAAGNSAPQIAARAKPHLYQGAISDAHGHLEGKRADPDGAIRAMERNNIDQVVIFLKSKGGWTDDDALEMNGRHPERVIPGIGFQNRGWRKLDDDFLQEVAEKAASGRFGWLGEDSFRGGLGGGLKVAPGSASLQRLLTIARRAGLPLTIHHNPFEKDGDGWRRTGEYQAMVDALAREPRATVVWAHWCGLAGTDVVRRALERLPNLHCDLAWYRKAQDTLPHRLVDGDGRFMPERRKLIADFPDRFLAAIDSAAKPGHLRRYDHWVRMLRIALGRLPSKVARKVATENFRRISRR